MTTALLVMADVLLFLLLCGACAFLNELKLLKTAAQGNLEDVAAAVRSLTRAVAGSSVIVNPRSGGQH